MAYTVYYLILNLIMYTSPFETFIQNQISKKLLLSIIKSVPVIYNRPIIHKVIKNIFTCIEG
jgi:hypothetical protein